MRKFESYKNWINEKFVEDDDPIESMGIGMMHDIDKWLEQETTKHYGYAYELHHIKDKLAYCIRRKAPLEFIDYLIPLYLKDPKQTNSEKVVINDCLYTATSYKNLDAVKFLVEKYNADVHESKDRSIISSIGGAWDKKYNGHIFIYFLEKKLVDPNELDGKWLILACQRNRLDVVEALIKAGVDVNIREDQALYEAAYKGRTRVMRILLKHGAKVNDKLKNALSFWKRIGRRILVTNMMTKMGLM
jgi:hypothetical protein